MEFRAKYFVLFFILLTILLSERCLAFSVSEEQSLITNVGNKSHAKAVDCTEVRQQNASFRCQFVLQTDDCHCSGGFFEYNEFIYCHLLNKHSLVFVILGFWLVYLFIALGVTAEEFFCPCLKTFAKSLRMSDSVAGVTLLALGNGAPDIFSVIVAITDGDEDAAPLAFQELYGSGMFVTTVVVGSIQLTNTFKLARRPFLRDVIFYICAAAWTFTVLYKKHIRTAEAIGFIALYAVYVTLVIVGQAVNRTMRSHGSKIDEEEDEPLDTPQPKRHLSHAAIRDLRPSADFTEFAPTDTSPLINDSGAKFYASMERENKDDDDSVFGESDSSENFFERITGIDIKEWKSKVWFWKIFDLIKVPLQISLNLTIPVIDVDAVDLRWNKWLSVLQWLVSPMACTFITKRAFLVIHKKFVLWELVLIIGAVIPIIEFVTTSSKRPPRFPVIYAIRGFIASIIWIYALAQELVNLLMAFGISLGLTNAVLGLTLLAWGNSIGDFISNLAMAKNGAPRMAIAACYGGPLLNMMLGVGISCILSSLTHDGDVKLIRGHSQYIISAAFLAASLLSALVFMPSIMKFVTSKWAGIYLIFLYIAYLSISIVNEVSQHW